LRPEHVDRSTPDESQLRTPYALLRKSLLAVLVVAAAWASGAGAEAIAILSLVGDHLTIVSPGKQIGSHLDQNQYQVVPLADTGFDDFAVRVAHDVITKARPEASLAPFRARDPALYALRDAWLDADSVNVRALIALVAENLPKDPDARLLLIAPYKGTLELKSDGAYRGSGKVAGLGFYLDSATRMTRTDTMESGIGFLGVFANFQLLLINLKTNAVEAHERIIAGTTFPAAMAPDRTPWNALSAARKSEELDAMMKREIERVLPLMLSQKVK